MFNKMNYVVPLLLAGMVCTLSTGCVTGVEPGYMGVKTNSMDGKIDKQPLPAGTHIVPPWVTVYEFPTSQVELEFEALPVLTKEGQEVKVDFSIYVQPASSTDKVVKLFSAYLKPFDGKDSIKTRWKSIIQQAARYSFAQYNITELYTSGGNKAGTTMKSILTQGLLDKAAGLDLEGLGNDGVTIKSIQIKNVQLPPAIVKSIEMKTDMEQKKLSAEVEVIQKTSQAKVQVAVAEGNANARVAEARGLAESQLISAKADADAMRLRGINRKQYVELEKAKIFGETINPKITVMTLPNTAIMDLKGIFNLK